MHKNATANLADIFHSNLLQIEPSHLIDNYQQQKVRMAAEQEHTKSSGDTVQSKFTDPRTQIVISTFTCDHRDVDLAAKNILLQKCIETSKLSAAEHSACLNAIPKLKYKETALSTEDKVHRLTYFSTKQRRSDEKIRFLAFLKRYYYETLSHRYHSVNPAIDAFITQKWKRRLLDLHADTATDAYRMSTALRINRQTDDDINAELVHQEHYGNVSKMVCDATILRQSNENLLRAYQRNHGERFRKSIRDKSIEIAAVNRVDAIVPLSTLKLLISDCEDDWSIRVKVRDAESSSILYPSKEVTFEKPLPPLYLSGNERTTRGYKYVLRTTVCPQHAGSFCHSTNTTTDPVTSSDQVIEGSTASQTDYKMHPVDEIAAKYLKEGDPSVDGNCSFRVWNISNGDATIRLMIPAKSDAFRTGENGSDVQMVNLSPKVEFQAEYGAEVMTKGQLLREWCHQYFRPDSITVRGK